MEVFSLILQPQPTYLNPTNLPQNRCFNGQFPRFCNPKKYAGCKKFNFAPIIAQQSPGAARYSSTAVKAMPETVDSKYEDIVFVAGATGRVGSRTVRELLKLGFQVRAGVRSAQRTESLVQSVKQMMLNTEVSGGLQSIEKLEIVECDLEQPDQIVPALGRASTIICCIGASEKEVFDVTGPYRIDYMATKNLINAATFAKVDHFILLTSLGTNKVGFPAAILNLFWGVLCWKRKAEEALIDCGLPYTIVRPGGMERPTDTYKETHNLTLSEEDTLFGGQVSNLQVAELMAFMAQNRDLCNCKVVEVIAETTAPLTPMGELLVKIPSKREMFKGKDPSPSTRQVDPEPTTSSIPEVPTMTTEKETAEDRSMVLGPLSPYTAYEDLKPPTSPCPSRPDNSKKGPPEASKIVDGVPNVIDGTLTEKVPQELAFYHSPYPVYEDLKPPTTPTPSPPNLSSSSVTNADSQIATVSTNGALEPVILEEAEDGAESSFPKAEPLSPYTMYDDMKPPTSPTPAAPNSLSNSMDPADATPPIATIPSNDAVELVATESTGDEEKPTKPRLQPLSPYTMYDDLKPPTSPMPSPRNG